ncbi:transferase [Candidatus Woesearchaeota archaeon]|nr:transferase [Candidatus Woesearchaeota archaeon]
MKKILDKVTMGDGAEVQDYVIIGLQPSGKQLETKIGKNALIRSHTVIYAGNTIGDNFVTGHRVNIRENNRIGNDVSIGTASTVEYSSVIEDGVRIHTGSFIPEFTTLRKGCWIGPNVTITNARYPKSKEVKKRLKGAVVGEDAIIGANSTLLPEITIGKNALIGAGSVVTKDVPENAVMAGNPAKQIGHRHKLVYKDTGEKAY